MAETSISKLTEARVVAEKTRDRLASQGWCLWDSEVLREVIAVVKNDWGDSAESEASTVRAIADAVGDPCPCFYTETELGYLIKMDDATLQLAHAAKQEGAMIQGVQGQ